MMSSSKSRMGRQRRRPNASVISERESGNELPPAVPTNRERATIVGTLSFPVKKSGPLRDNSDIIAEIIRRRRPGLLLCAGYSVPSKRGLRPVIAATRRTGTVAVVEANEPRPPISFRIKDGRPVRMGKQFFADRKQTNNCPLLVSEMASALLKRRFRFSGRPVLLIVCGEITLIQGRSKVVFHRSAPPKLREAVQEERVMILNPTHTRMGNSGTIKAWRKFLSRDGRVYVSSSNWDIRRIKDRKGRYRRQKPSRTLHSLWHDSNCSEPFFQQECNSFCYREWELPR